MCKLPNSRSVFSLFSAIAFALPQTTQAQLAYSAFKEASVAYVGLAGRGMNFATANPAVLAQSSDPRRFSFTLEATHNNIRAAFKDELPDIMVQFAIRPHLTIALAQSERAPASTTRASRGGVRDAAYFRHPLRSLAFSYQQDWSAGIGWQFKPNWSAGLTMRHENYTVFPHTFGPTIFGQSYRAFDLGIRRSARRLNAGLVFRNFVKNRTTPPFSQPVRFVNITDPTQSFDWNPTQFNGVAFAPKFTLESGVHWLASSHWQFLADVSSRQEYAFGLRWRVFSQFFITAGNGKRFDRIYADAAVTYTALGGQFQKDKFALGVAWIVPRRSGRNQIVSMPFGMYTLEQNTNHRLLIASAFAL